MSIMNPFDDYMGQRDRRPRYPDHADLDRTIAAQRRRDIAALDPGQTAVRTSRIERGVELLAGRSVRLGVSERDGIARLNQLLEIPDLIDSHQAAAVADR